MKNKDFIKKNFNKNDYRTVDILIKFVKVTNKTIIIIVLLVILAILIYAGTLISKLFYDENIKVEKYLNEIYTGLDFKVKEVNVNSKGYGLYSAYCTKDINIEFYIYKDEKTNEIHDDFTQQYRKYYIEKIEDTTVKNILTINEKNTQYHGKSFLNDYEFWIEINEYEDIEKATTILYKIHQNFNQQSKIPGLLLLGGEIRQKNIGYISNGSFEYDMTLSQLLEREKENYVRYIDK